MSYNLLIMTFLFLLVKSSFGEVVVLKTKDVIKSDSIQKSILQEPYVSSHVTTNKDGQEMDFLAIGLHEKTCRIALRKISDYENYKEYLSFIEESLYFEDLSRVSFTISTSLFPIRLTLRFKIPRVKTVGVYPFYFEEGFLKDLKGEIHISEENGRCFFYITAKWKGKHTGFPSSLLEFFSKTIVKMGMEKFFRISLF